MSVKKSISAYLLLAVFLSGYIDTACAAVGCYARGEIGHLACPRSTMARRGACRSQCPWKCGNDPKPALNTARACPLKISVGRSFDAFEKKDQTIAHEPIVGAPRADQLTLPPRLRPLLVGVIPNGSPPDLVILQRNLRI